MSDLTASSVLERAVHALRDPSVTTFTRSQVAYLVAHLAEVVDLAYRLGYEFGHCDGASSATAHLTELNLDALRAGYDTPPFSAAEFERLRARAAADARPAGPYTGGPVPEWGADRRGIAVPDISTRVIEDRGGIRWTG
jgi:hypothetical protein